MWWRLKEVGYQPQSASADTDACGPHLLSRLLLPSQVVPSILSVALNSLTTWSNCPNLTWTNAP
jgi:hypothetical protein